MQVIALSWTGGVGIFVVVVAVCVVIALLVSRRAVEEDTAERGVVAESDVICPTCGERFVSEAELGRHVAQYHPSS
jgi:hypothetical protein